MKKRAVYLEDIDWDIVVSCLKDKIHDSINTVGSSYRVIWTAGANRARYIVGEIERGRATEGKTTPL